MKKLNGTDAIEYKKANPDAELNKYNDPTEDERFDISIEEAEAVISEDPALIYVEVDDERAFDLTKWADSHETSIEIATEIHLRHEGREDYIFENATNEQRDAIIADAWEMADKDENALYWGVDSYSR